MCILATQTGTALQAQPQMTVSGSFLTRTRFSPHRRRHRHLCGTPHTRQRRFPHRCRRWRLRYLPPRPRFPVRRLPWRLRNPPPRLRLPHHRRHSLPRSPICRHTCPRSDRRFSSRLMGMARRTTSGSKFRTVALRQRTYLNAPSGLSLMVELGTTRTSSSVECSPWMRRSLL